MQTFIANNTTKIVIIQIINFVDLKKKFILIVKIFKLLYDHLK